MEAGTSGKSSILQAPEYVEQLHRFTHQRMEDAQYHFGLVAFVSSSCYYLSTVAEYRMFRAILTILQIESAANDPLIRYSALLSMICALMSLLYGCIYIIGFGTMRNPYKAAEWAVVSIYTS
jgi:hypothetical protein